MKEAVKVPRGSLAVTEDALMTQVLTYFTTPEQINALEAELLPLNRERLPVKHMFCKGVYCREIYMPKGTLAIGHAHSEECLNIVVSGSVSVVVDGEVKRVSAPACFVSLPGVRKIGYVHEDTIWITVHPTRDYDIATIEAKMIVKSEAFKKYEEDHPEDGMAIASCTKDEFWEDRLDYFRFLDEIGLTQEQAKEMIEDLRDQIEFPPGAGDRVYVGTSKIHGNGLFAAFDEDSGTRLCPSRIGLKRTKAGRYTNHSKRPNCEFVPDQNGDIYLVAISKLAKGEELTVNYRQAKKASEEAFRISQLNTIK